MGGGSSGEQLCTLSFAYIGGTVIKSKEDCSEKQTIC